jgi:hypothetical protein
MIKVIVAGRGVRIRVRDMLIVWHKLCIRITSPSASLMLTELFVIVLDVPGVAGAPALEF